MKDWMTVCHLCGRKYESPGDRDNPEYQQAMYDHKRRAMFNVTSMVPSWHVDPANQRATCGACL